MEPRITDSRSVHKLVQNGVMEHFLLLLAGLKFLQAGHPARRDNREGGGGKRERDRESQTDRQTDRK